MASLEALHDDLKDANNASKKLWEDHGYSTSDLSEAAELAATARDLYIQIAKDFAALDAALSKSRG